MALSQRLVIISSISGALPRTVAPGPDTVTVTRQRSASTSSRSAQRRAAAARSTLTGFSLMDPSSRRERRMMSSMSVISRRDSA